MGKDVTGKQERVIRASEIGQYVYCARAWWLGCVKNVASTNTRELAHGEEVHQQHGRMVWGAGAFRTAALLLIVIAVVLIAVALLL